MAGKQPSQHVLNIAQEHFLALFRTAFGSQGGCEDDEHPLKHGPWDPVVRSALERAHVFDPQSASRKLAFAALAARHPEIWDGVGGDSRFGAEVELNPQPLPPRFAFLVALAQAVVDRAELIDEVASASRQDGEQQGIIIVSGYIARFADDFCGNGFRFKWPWPGPRPNWFAEEVAAIDRVVIAAQFDQAAKESASPTVQQSLAEATAKLVTTALAAGDSSKLRAA